MASARRHFDVFVKNAAEEYITTLEVFTTERVGPSNSEDLGATSSTPTDAVPSKCVVTDYTRDSAVLETTAGAAGAVTMVCVEKEDKLRSFRSYLAARKKAGVVKLPDGGKLFLLPIKDSAVVHGESIVALIQDAHGWRLETPAHHAAQALHVQVRSRVQQNTTHSSPRDSRLDQASASGGDGPAIGGLLGSIMGSMSQTHKNVADTATVDRVRQLQEQNIKQRVEHFKTEVREKLAAFASDPSATSHAFPHVEKSLRSIQHVLAEDWDGITTRTEGDVDDRHVVVYRLGYEPPEEEVQCDPQVHMGLARKSTPAPVSAAPPPPVQPPSGADGAGAPAPHELVRIGTVVKDKRTVQQIEEEGRKRRRRGFEV